MRQLIPTSVLAAAASIVLTAGPASALQIKDASYDFWHQWHGEDRESVIRIQHHLFGEEPSRETATVDDGMGGTMDVDFYSPGTSIVTSGAFQTGVVIDSEFILTEASPLLDVGTFTVRVAGETHFVKDWWMPGGLAPTPFNSNFNLGNLVLLHLADPLPASQPTSPVSPISARGKDVEIVSYGSILFGQPDTGGDGGDGDGDGEAGFAGGIRRSGFNKFDVTELDEIATADGLLAMDQDAFPGQDINDVDKDVPVVLEATLNGNDAGAFAFAGGDVVGVASTTFTIQSSETSQLPRTISLFTDLSEWADDIAFFLDRDNWILDDFGDLTPMRPEPGLETSPDEDFGFWARSLAGLRHQFPAGRELRRTYGHR